MADTATAEIISFRRDMTLRLSCRAGDFLLWFGYRDLFSGPEAIQCFDIWEMRDGYHVTITNRLEDLPAWFRLHPTEVCDSFVYRMVGKFEKGITPVSLWTVQTCGGSSPAIASRGSEMNAPIVAP